MPRGKAEARSAHGAGNTALLWRRERRFGLLPCQGIDEAGTRVGMALPARLQHVAQQEQAGQPKAVLEIFVGKVALHLALAQERRRAQQAVAPRLAGAA